MSDDETYPAVEAVHRTRGEVLLSNGEILPVKSWLGSSEWETGSLEDVSSADARLAIAGPDSYWKWHLIDLSKFEEANTQ